MFFDRYPPTSFWQLLQFSLSFSSVALQSVFSVKLFFSCCAWYLMHFQGTRTFWKNKKTWRLFLFIFCSCISSLLFFWTSDWTHVGAFWFILCISDLTWFLPLSDSLCCVLVNFSEGADPALSYIHEFSHWLVVVFYL